MTRKVYSLDLSPRENRHAGPSLVRDVLDLVLGATLLFVLYVLVSLVML